MAVCPVYWPVREQKPAMCRLLLRRGIVGDSPPKPRAMASGRRTQKRHATELLVEDVIEFGLGNVAAPQDLQA